MILPDVAFRVRIPHALFHRGIHSVRKMGRFRKRYTDPGAYLIEGRFLRWWLQLPSLLDASEALRLKKLIVVGTLPPVLCLFLDILTGIALPSSR